MGTEVVVEVVVRSLAGLPTDEATLDDDERARAGRFERAEDSARFVAGRALLRAELARRTGRAPDAVVLASAACPLCGGPHGRPIAPSAGIELSLSRSADAVVVAFAPVTVGVDVESLSREVSVQELEVARHPAEPVPADGAAALRAWVRKEAYLKGLGTGLGLDPASVDLRTAPPGWTLLDVEVETRADLLVALAVETDATVRVVLS